MVTLEQVEKLCERADVTYDEAKEILQQTNGDILEAIIILEKQNRVKPPKGGGYYSSRNTEQDSESNDPNVNTKKKSRTNESLSFWKLLGRVFKWCGEIVNKGNRNSFDIIKNGDNTMSIPVTVLAVLLIFMFWITIPLIIVGLFFGYRYRFSGPDLGKENVNRAMDTVAGVAENLKKEVKGEILNGEDSDN